MKELSLQYNRGSEHNTIDVCTKENLFLGKIAHQGVFGISFIKQETQLNNEDAKEINFVMQRLSEVM